MPQELAVRVHSFMKIFVHAFAVLSFGALAVYFSGAFWTPFLAIIPALIVTRILRYDFSLWRFTLLGALVPLLLYSNRISVKLFPLALPALIFSALASGDLTSGIFWFEVYLAAYLLFTWFLRRFNESPST